MRWSPGFSRLHALESSNRRLSGLQLRLLFVRVKPMPVPVSSRVARTLSYRRKAFYGFLATCIFFVGLELVLRLVGVSSTLEERDPFVGFEASVPLFVERQVGDQVLLETANNKLAYFNAQQFPKHKPSDTYRVFCVGGSTTYGRPYNDGTSFVGWLRELLNVVDKSRRWEVINAGGISYASYRVATVVDELCHYSPDLFVVYMGHNEFLEERTYRDFRSRTDRLRPTLAWLRRSRVVSVAERLLSKTDAPSKKQFMLPAEVDTILDHDVGPVAYHRDAALRSQTVEHFQFNLRWIIATARAVGAKVLLITPSANRKDFSPFKSEFLDELNDDQQLAWFDQLAQASELEVAGDIERALACLQAAELIDGGRADLHFQLGRLQFLQGEYSQAQEAFERALEYDVCSLRAITEIRTSIEHEAIALRVPLIDFDGILKNDCVRNFGHSALGNEYFLDHVHPNVATHRLLAVAIVEALIQTKTVSPNQQWRESAIATASRRVESTIDPELQSRALTNLAQVLSWAGKQAEAGPIAAQAVRVRAEHGLPEEPESLFYFAVHLETMGESERAITLYEKVLDRAAKSLQARKRLAMLLLDAQRFDEAKLHFEQVVSQDPADASNHHLLGLVLLELEQNQEALESLLQANRLDPDNAAIFADLTLAQGKIDAGE